MSQFHPKKDLLQQSSANSTMLMGADGPDALYFRVPYSSLDRVLDIMRGQVQQWRGDQRIRDKAVQITKTIPTHQGTGLPNRRDFNAVASAIYEWMKKNIAYVRDPDGIEYLQSPLKTLQYGYGDCDDQSILGAALMGSLGIPTKFKVVKTTPGQYTHVYVIYEADGEWKAFDPTLHAYAGAELSDSKIFGHKLVSLNDALTLQKKTNNMSRFNIPKPKNSLLADSGLGVDPVTVGAGVSTAIKIGKKLFGRGSDPNYSSNSLVDTIANYEKISTTRAQSLAPKLVEAKIKGASNNEIGRMVASAGGYSVSAVMTSGKWPLLTGQLNQAIQDVQQEMALQNQNSGSGLPSTTNVAGVNLKSPLTLGFAALALAGVGYAIYSQKK